MTFPLTSLRRGIQSIVDGPFGSNLASKHYVDAGARVIRLGNIGQMHFRDSDRAFVELSHFLELGRHAVEPGDLLVAGLGDDRNAVGRACLAPAGLGPAMVKADCFRLRTDPGVLLHQFVGWYLNSRRAQVLVERESRGATRVRATPEAIASIEISLPPLTMQRRIADFLDDRVARIDQIIIARRSQIATIEAQFVAKRRCAVLGLNGATRPIDLPWAEKVGNDWSVRRISQIARMGTGHTPSRNEPEYWVDCDIPWLTTSDVHRFRHDDIDRLAESEVRINAAGLANSAAVLHPTGTVALSRTASAGFSIIMDVDMATSQDFVTWTCGEDLRPEFLLHTLRVMRPYLLGYLSMGSTHKTIYFPDLMDLRAPVPSASLQEVAIRDVEAAASERRALSGALNRQVELLKEYKESLITAAVTGELDVTTAGSGVPG